MMHVKKYLLIRILGNDLQSLHGHNQTYNNLKFTLEYEHHFENTDKVFVLNRITNQQKKQKLIDLLNQHSISFVEIPFEFDKFEELPLLNINEKQFDKLSLNEKVKLLYFHNLYLINNNASRNYCIDYGKKLGYQWTFVLDSNSYFTSKDFFEIIDNIRPETEYLIIPQKRLKDSELQNDILLNSEHQQYTQSLPIQEPQIAFKNTSKIIFNPELPYGGNPKAELLNAFQVKGKWNSWKNYWGLKIRERRFQNVNYQILSQVFRLNPHNDRNRMIYNRYARWKGLYFLVKELMALKNLNRDKENIVSQQPKQKIIKDIHVVMCCWKRLELLNLQFKNLNKQSVSSRIHWHIINNNFVEKATLEEIVKNCQKKYTNIKVSITHYKNKHFCFQRFYYIKDILLKKYIMDYVIIIDDDQLFDQRWVENIWKLRQPKIYSGWYCKKWKKQNKDYWNSDLSYSINLCNMKPEVKNCPYIGPGGSIIDVSIFHPTSILWNKPTDLPSNITIDNMDDLWLSFVTYKSNYILQRSFLPEMRNFNFLINSSSNEKSLHLKLKKEKQLFFEYLMVKDKHWIDSSIKLTVITQSKN